MPEHETPLIATIAAGLVLAFGFGLAAHRLRISPLVGYLLAGILVGPFTPGFVADQALANQLAEVGVILLLFAVGLHFSLADLISVRATAFLARSGNWPSPRCWAWRSPAASAGPPMPVCCSASPSPAAAPSSSPNRLQEHRLLDTDRGRIAVGWLIVQDLVMVVVLVLLPALGHTGNTPLPGHRSPSG